MSRATDLMWSSPAFLENYSYTITKLSELLTDKRPGNIVDRLVESSLLTHDQRATIDSENVAALAARRILDTLVRKEEGSFRKFCIAIRNSTGNGQELYGALIRSSHRSQSNAYGTDAPSTDLRTSYAPDSNRQSDLETRTGPPPEMSLQSGIWQVEREKAKELKVFVNLFLQQYDKVEWKVHAVCRHQKEEAEKTEERYKKKSWKSSDDDWWEFPLNDDSEDKVIIQLADDMKDYWSQKEDIVLQRSSLMSSANTSQRIKEMNSLPSKSLHFKAKYGKDDNATFNSVYTFSFLLSPESGQEKRVQNNSESKDPGSNLIPVAVVVIGALVIIGAAIIIPRKWAKEVSKKVTYR